jgi:hypothetical protein
MKSGSPLRRASQTTVLDMSSTNVTTSAYATLLAAASNLYGCSGIEIFNPSGTAMIIALGAAGSEVAIPYTVLPGGTTGFIMFEINKGVRISLKGLSAGGGANVTTGAFILNQFI